MLKKSYCKFKIFETNQLDNEKESKKREIENLFKNMSEEDFLDKTKDDYIKELKSKYLIEIPTINFGKRYVNTEEVGDTDYYIFKIPFDGENTEYFKFSPGSKLNWSKEVYIINHDLCFEVIERKNDPNYVERESKQIFENIKTQKDYVDKEIEPYNNSLQKFIEDEYDKRNQRVSNRKNTLKTLDLPTERPE
jgi:predicted carbohydrate-binding protein with CBM5 and CBM33 domain